MQKIYTRAERNALPNWQQQRWMLVGGDGTIEGQKFAKVATIPVRSLKCVGGERNTGETKVATVLRNYFNRKQLERRQRAAARREARAK